MGSEETADKGIKQWNWNSPSNIVAVVWSSREKWKRKVNSNIVHIHGNISMSSSELGICFKKYVLLHPNVKFWGYIRWKIIRSRYFWWNSMNSSFFGNSPRAWRYWTCQNCPNLETFNQSQCRERKRQTHWTIRRQMISMRDCLIIQRLDVISDTFMLSRQSHDCSMRVYLSVQG